MSWNEENLLSEMVHHYQDSGKPSESGSCSMKFIEIDSQGRNGTGS
jgi:hypothetical protein